MKSTPILGSLFGMSLANHAPACVYNPWFGRRFWEKYIHAANELVLLEPDFRFSLDFSREGDGGALGLNRTKELLAPLYKRASAHATPPQCDFQGRF